MVTTTATTSSTVSGSSILTALGSGSGVDTASLITSLVQAQFASRNKQLSKQDTTATAQISSVAKIQSGITGFNSALKTLAKGGSLTTQPTSSDSSVLTAIALPGAKLSGLSAAVEVDRVATAQTATTANSFASRAATVGTGNLTLTFGTGTVANGALTAFAAGAAAPVTIAIDAAHQTLAGIASAINAAAAGVSATIVTDSDGTARLTLKGGTGSAQAFTLSGDTAALSAFDVGVGESATTIGSAALNAQLKLDGVAVERATNTVKDLIEGVQLNLVGTAAGKPATLGSTTPTAGLQQAVTDFVTTYNAFLADLRTETDPTNGPLRHDFNATTLVRSLRGLTLTTLSTGAADGAPVNLAAIGVSTNKDGSLSVDAARLSSALSKTPDAVEALFADGTGATGGGLSAALDAIATAATDKSILINGQVEHIGFVGSTALYTAAKVKAADAQAKVDTDTTAYQQRLTKQYAASDGRIAAYKASQTALQNQIDQWNKVEVMLTGYATPLGRNPETTYRQIELAGQTAEADGPALVQLLYDEAIRALRGAAWAAENGKYAMKSDKVTRATAILFALEAGLDFDAGGDVATTLARLYAVPVRPWCSRPSGPIRDRFATSLRRSRKSVRPGVASGARKTRLPPR